MKEISLLLSILLLAACSHAVPYKNDRPMRPFPPASELVPQCKITVQFNEDEASVPESKYLDTMFCLGVMEGILGANSHISSKQQPMFCPPSPGIKTWIAAKAVVDFAAANPQLLTLDETEFAIRALATAYPCPER